MIETSEDTQPEVIVEPGATPEVSPVDLSMPQGSQVMSDGDVAAMLANMGDGKPLAEAPSEVIEPEGEVEAEPIEDDTPEKVPGTDSAAIAENKRLRAKNRELSDATQGLREDIARINGRLDESTKSQGGPQPVEAQVKAATEEGLESAIQSLELKMYEATQEGDREAHQRLVAGKALVEKELRNRQKAHAQSGGKASAQSQFVQVREDITTRYPEVLQEGTPFHTEVQQFMNDNQALMKELGPLGEVMAISSVIGLKPELLTQKQQGQITRKIETGINDVVKHAVKRRGSSVPSSTQPVVALPSSIDGLNEMAEKMKRGEMTLSQLG